MDQELLQITAVNTIFDLFLMYGLEAFNTEQPTNKKNEGRVIFRKNIDGTKFHNFHFMLGQACVMSSISL